MDYTLYITILRHRITNVVFLFHLYLYIYIRWLYCVHTYALTISSPSHWSKIFKKSFPSYFQGSHSRSTEHWHFPEPFVRARPDPSSRSRVTHVRSGWRMSRVWGRGPLTSQPQPLRIPSPRAILPHSPRAVPSPHPAPSSSFLPAPSSSLLPAPSSSLPSASSSFLFLAYHIILSPPRAIPSSLLHCFPLLHPKCYLSFPSSALISQDDLICSFSALTHRIHISFMVTINGMKIIQAT